MLVVGTTVHLEDLDRSYTYAEDVSVTALAVGAFAGGVGSLLPSGSRPVWSILDQEGTQAMMHSALGDAAKVADYDSIKKRILASRYTMSFQSGVNFDLSVLTSDSMTAGTLSSLVKAGILYKKLNATPSEKTALDATTVDSDSSTLLLHFKTDDQKFQALMKSPLFAAVSH